MVPGAGRGGVFGAYVVATPGTPEDMILLEIQDFRALNHARSASCLRLQSNYKTPSSIGFSAKSDVRLFWT
jgi:hypothetical protein